MNPILRTILEGVYDSGCPLSNLRGTPHLVQIIWKYIIGYWKSLITIGVHEKQVKPPANMEPGTRITVPQDVFFLELDGFFSIGTYIEPRFRLLRAMSRCFPSSSSLRLSRSKFFATTFLSFCTTSLLLTVLMCSTVFPRSGVQVFSCCLKSFICFCFLRSSHQIILTLLFPATQLKLFQTHVFNKPI